MIAAVIHIATICADYLLHAVPYILTAAQKAAVSAFHASLKQLHGTPHLVIAVVGFGEASPPQDLPFRWL